MTDENFRAISNKCSVSILLTSYLKMYTEYDLRQASVNHGHVIFCRFVFCAKDESTFESRIPLLFSDVQSLMAPIFILLHPFVTKSIDLELLALSMSDSYIMRLCLFPDLLSCSVGGVNSIVSMV